MPKGLPNNVKRCLEKSIDAAMLAVETYNKPAVKFKSGGYIVMMTIAFTSFFHAVFFKQRKRPFHKKKGSNRFEKRDGDYVYWELSHCLKEYFKADVENPIRKNLEFFIPLRNIIEHKSVPEIDPDIFGECQAMLLNYDKLMEQEFGGKYCLKESLSFALQLYSSSKNMADAVKQNKDAKQAVSFINKFRSSLGADITKSGHYSFKAFLLQVANHNSKDALPIQFIQWDKLNDDEKKNVERVAALVKYIEKPVVNNNLLLPSKVVEEVQKGLGNPKINRNGKMVNQFNADVHTRCWKKFQVRPQNGDGNPANTKPDYCIYNQLNKNYGYTDKWVQFLIEKLSEENGFQSMYS